MATYLINREQEQIGVVDNADLIVGDEVWIGDYVYTVLTIRYITIQDGYSIFTRYALLSSPSNMGSWSQ